LDKSVISRAVTVAGRRFAPGHLGELTQQVPFEMAGAVLEQTCRVQRRVRDLPARVVACLLLAGCLFAELGYGQVWHRLAAGLGRLPVAAALSEGSVMGGLGPRAAALSATKEIRFSGPFFTRSGNRLGQIATTQLL